MYSYAEFAINNAKKSFKKLILKTPAFGKLEMDIHVIYFEFTMNNHHPIQ